MAALDRARTTESLYAFSRKLAGTATLDDVLWATAYQTALMLKVRVVLLLPEDGTIAVKAGYPPEDILDSADLAAAKWAWENDRAAGRGSDTLPGAKRLFLPMHTGRGAVGVMGIDSDKPGPLLTPDQRRLLDALRDQGALAIERVRLVEEMDRVERAAETERLRSALLTSISHDLKTPLAAVLGAAGTLRDLADKLSDAEKADLLATIIDESERLNRFIANLLDMTKLESGAVTPNIATARSRRDRRQRIAPGEPHPVAAQRRAGARVRICRCSNSTPCCSNRSCSIFSTMPPNMLRPRRRFAFRPGAAARPSACAFSTKAAAFPPAISSTFSISSTARRRPIRCAPAPAWTRDLARLRRSHARHHRRGQPPRPHRRHVHHQPADPAPNGNAWTPPHERRSAPRAGGRRRAAHSQAAAHGAFRARLSDSRSAQRQGRARHAQPSVRT